MGIRILGPTRPCAILDQRIFFSRSAKKTVQRSARSMPRTSSAKSIRRGVSRVSPEIFLPNSASLSLYRRAESALIIGLSQKLGEMHHPATWIILFESISDLEQTGGGAG